jgi:hypothetical protein
MHPESGITMQTKAPVEMPQAQLKLLTRGQSIALFIAISLGFVGMIAGIIIAVIRWNYALSHFGPAVVWHWAAPGLLLGLISFLIAFGAFILLCVRRKHMVFAHAGGITLQLGRGRRNFPWETLQDLKLSVIRYGFPWWQWGSQSTALVTTQEGKTLQLRGPLSELERFTSIVKHYLYPLRLDVYRKALASRQTIDFGSLQCTPSGLMYRRKLYSWDTIQSAQLEAGRLRLAITKDGKIRSLSIPASTISNPDLCAQVITNMEY